MADKRAKVTEFALSMPGAREDFPWGERVVKVGRKVFVFLGSDGSTEPSFSVKLVESHGHALATEGARPTGYGLAKAGWVTVPIAHVPLATLREWVEESYRIVAPKRLVAKLDAGG